ncbi:FHS family L-fucose permease-like MFS transporter [Arcanobacterium pluranimalium]|uniref:L-fucose:H+ symporter permease n=1 Tax=Arcanobacterium pluranimalium TaxID=108028 RepID=UPI00195657D9|nr:L-fucose:H+ symporter permease [Arcanobacterium pluranimalium]MBM7825003.1 FHS family L-fucose permease-like MFS transporter [Arcanobacterium pluranimalium]
MTTIETNAPEEGVKNETFGLIKDPSLQLSDGYLNKTPILQYILLSICFPMWGAAASLNDILITQFKAIFELSDFASAFVQSAFYGGYFLLAIPASRVIRKWSYKSGILVGLSFYIIGCTLFFPASHMATYTVFLAALFAIATGLSFLETSCNTYSSMVGPRRLATLRLNISQTFYPLGSIFGILLGKYLIFTEGDALHKQLGELTGAERTQFANEMLQRTLQPYRFIIIVLAILFIIVAITQFPHCKPMRAHHEVKASIGETLSYLVKNAKFREGILAQFLYVGMQTAVWSFTIRLALNLDDSLNERAASNYMVAAFIAFFLGKVLANILMTKFNADLVLIGYSVAGVLALAYVIAVPNMTAVYAAILTSGLFGPCWATIYARTLDSIEDKRHTETGGAVIVMSIIGGAVIPVIQGLVSDKLGSMQMAFSVSLVCFVAVLVYFLRRYKASKNA